MANARVKPIHLIIIKFGYECRAVCDEDICVKPTEVSITKYNSCTSSKGTFNPTKVTCKRCLKHPQYKEAMDRVKYPLFFLKENSHA